MADLQEDRSLVPQPARARGRPLGRDWGNPSRADRWLTLDDYIEGYLGDCVDKIRRQTGSEKANLLGICEGGVFTTAYAALEPEKVNALVNTITPIDFHADTGEERLGLRLHQPVDPKPAAGGDRPADRRPLQPARPVHGRGLLDDDADALAAEVQPRHARGGR
jgi:pimeloyl-ACP methyl ester carboxylesterase